MAKLYICLLSLISRQLPKRVSTRIQNSVCQFSWPKLQFKPKRVLLGRDTRVFLVPHLGEFDQAALFTKELDYEAPVFEWLAETAPPNYNLVIEIGANVGVYTVFLDALAKDLPGSKLRNIIAFEPSQEPFRRLLENLRANKARHVTAIQAAVGSESGLRSFFEPEGHLTNGSFIREFAELFSDSIIETNVAVVGVAELERFLKGAEKALIKLDVEGFEPVLIAALSTLLRKYHPDLLIEVLDDTAEQLEQTPALRGYRKFLITAQGLQEAPSVFACSACRDWLLRFQPNIVDTGEFFSRNEGLRI
jgi:FkbM family methyltransferase